MDFDLDRVELDALLYELVDVIDSVDRDDHGYRRFLIKIYNKLLLSFYKTFDFNKDDMLQLSTAPFKFIKEED